MNTKTKFTRFVVALVLLVSGLGLFASTALAQKPVKSEYELPGGTVLTGVCSFPVEVQSAVKVTEFDFFDQDGSLTRIGFHMVEQDTFTANGKSLVGMPIAFSGDFLFDRDGFPTQGYTNGVSAKVWLPDGSLFMAAGRIDWAAHGFPSFVLSPDHGATGNVGGFCAALR